MCPNIASLEERIIEVAWNDIVDKKYSTTIMIRALKKENMLLDIISKTSGQNIVVQSIINLEKGLDCSYELTILVENKESLDDFIRSLESMPDILGVERIIQ